MKTSASLATDNNKPSYYNVLAAAANQRLHETWQAIQGFLLLACWHFADCSYASSSSSFVRFLKEQGKEREEKRAKIYWMALFILFFATIPLLLMGSFLLSLFTFRLFDVLEKTASFRSSFVYRTPLERWRMNEREVLFSWRQRLYLPFHLCAII